MEETPGAETAIPPEIAAVVEAVKTSVVKEVVKELVPQLGELIRDQVREGLLQAANTVASPPDNTTSTPAKDGGQHGSLAELVLPLLMRGMHGGGGDGIGGMQKQVEQVSGVVNTLFSSIINPLDEMSHRAEMRAYRSMEILSRVGLTPAGIKEMEERKPQTPGGDATSKTTSKTTAEYVAEAVK